MANKFTFFDKMINKYPSKTLNEVIEILLNDIDPITRGLCVAYFDLTSDQLHKILNDSEHYVRLVVQSISKIDEHHINKILNDVYLNNRGKIIDRILLKYV